MSLIDRFEQLTPEQKQQTLLVIQKQGLDAFLAEVGGDLSNEEKATAQDYFMAQKVELTDEEMAAATGGAWFKYCAEGYFEYSFAFLGPKSPCVSWCSEYVSDFADSGGKKYCKCLFFNALHEMKPL